MFAALLALGIMSAAVCVTAGYNRMTRVFVPRYTEPDVSESCYYADNIFYNSGYGIPNCTAYAWGRAYELLGEPPRLCTGDAGNWFDFNKKTGYYPYGSTPKPGAIACFDNEYGGHVAVVESIDEGVITFSNSAYQGAPFYLSTANVNDTNPGKPDWTFQGYIYPAEFDEGTPVRLRRVCAPAGLNLREYAELGSGVLTVIPDGTPLVITGTVASGERVWCETTFGGLKGYCAGEYLAE